MNNESRIIIQRFRESVGLILLGLGIFILGAGFASAVCNSISFGYQSVAGATLLVLLVGLFFALMCILFAIPSLESEEVDEK